MDIGALKNDDFEVRVPFMDAEVCIRHVSPEELEAIQRKATKADWDRQHRKVEKLDQMVASRLIGRAAVRGWKGITMDGEEFPFSEENCDFLMTRWAEFARFVGTVCLDLQTLVEMERREKEKNSGHTSGQA